jgi:hypothetical protein
VSPKAAEQPPVVRHLRFELPDGFGVALCGELGGKLQTEIDGVNCAACIGHHLDGTRCVPSSPEAYETE